MKYFKPFVSGLMLLSACTLAYSQHNFNSIKICHSKKGQLREIAIGEYVVQIKNGQLLSLSSMDDVVNYEAEKKLLVVKNLGKGSWFGLQLSNDGVVAKNKDTSFVLSSPKSVGLNSSSGNNHTDVLYSLGDFSSLLEFKNGELSKITLPTTGKYIIISLIRIQGVYTWDLGIESSEHLNKVALAYVFEKPFLLSISDNTNKVGVRLLAKKKNGIFTELVGQKVFDEGSFVSDNAYKLKYTSKGELKKTNSKFNLECKE